MFEQQALNRQTLHREHAGVGPPPPVGSVSHHSYALDNPGEVAEALVAYLKPRLGAGPLHFIDGPARVPQSWETHIYRFHVVAARPMPLPFTSPLALRVYTNPRGIPRARHDFLVQRHMGELGYPVAEPLLLEEDCTLFGGPFLVLRWAPGITLLERLRQRFRLFLWAPEQLAKLHLSLHAQSATGFPAPPGPFLDRRLDELDALVGIHRLNGLIPGLAWLGAHRPLPPAVPRILHLDFHPANVMVHEDEVTGDLDWSESDVGDLHADVAMTLLLMRTAPVRIRTLSERILAGPCRWALCRRYFRTYSRRQGIARVKLRYYLAWASLRRLAVCGAWLRAGPEVTGFKASSIQYVSADHVDALANCFWRVTGVGVDLKRPRW
jgi:aminoglycoside phosphotransferase (APT) family kinase protein